MAKDGEVLPQQPGCENEGEVNPTSHYHLHLHDPKLRPAEIDAYRRLAAEAGIDFAEKVLASNERCDTREMRSMVVGMVTAGVILVSLIVAVTASIILLGWWQSLLVAFILLGAGLVLRVLLTGQWSDTSWFGQFISGNNKPSDDSDSK